MKFSRAFPVALAGVILLAAGLLTAGAQPANVASTPPVYVPDMTHANEQMPDDVLVWDDLLKATNTEADETEAHFVFNFTNVARNINTTVVTNISTVTNLTELITVTNITTVTNSITPASVTILSVRPSCGCTTAQLPEQPWTIPPGTNGQIGVTVNLEGKNGTLFKYVDVATDKGIKRLYVRITVLPPVVPAMTDADRERGVAAAKVDRQAVFKGDCASCHIAKGTGKYGKALYDSVCAVCHEAEERATMVPDLHNLKVSTGGDFWRTWISQGKAGSLMPAFSSAQGGPLSDLQIASLTSYLSQTFPSRVPSPQ